MVDRFETLSSGRSQCQLHKHMNREINNPGHRPYWRRAHRDWRMWIIVILMLAAMAVYLATGDLRWPIHAQPQPLVPIAS